MCVNVLGEFKNNNKKITVHVFAFSFRHHLEWLTPIKALIVPLFFSTFVDTCLVTLSCFFFFGLDLILFFIFFRRRGSESFKSKSRPSLLLPVAG